MLGTRRSDPLPSAAPGKIKLSVNNVFAESQTIDKQQRLAKHPSPTAAPRQKRPLSTTFTAWLQTIALPFALPSTRRRLSANFQFQTRNKSLTFIYAFTNLHPLLYNFISNPTCKHSKVNAAESPKNQP